MRFIKSGNKKNPKTDEELLKEFNLSADLEILGELYSRYMHLVYGVCLKYLKEREEAMDSVMYIFERLISELAKHNIRNFKSWLHVVTKNYCLMHLRSQKSKKERLDEWINDASGFMENSALMHPIDSNEPDMTAALADCIEKLKKEQKECIRQFYYKNRCYNEIAEKLHLDEKKVKSHLQNAKRNLKLCLEEKNESKKEK